MQTASNSNESPSHNHNFSRLLVSTVESQEVDDETSVRSMGLLFILVKK
jgi:hypothetical protein